MDLHITTRRAIVALLVVTLVSSAIAHPAMAQSDQPDWADDLYEDAQSMVGTYNEQVTEADLGRAAGQLKGERINLVITDQSSGETATFSFRMDEQLRITELDDAPREDATLRMTTDRQTVDRINSAEQPGQEFRDAVRNRDIEITGVSMVNKVKWTVINSVGGALGVFESATNE